MSWTQCLLTSWLLLAACRANGKQPSLTKLFKTFETESNLWMVDRQDPKAHLEKAFAALEKLTPLLVSGKTKRIPKHISRSSLATNIVEFYQTTDHLRLIVPLLEYELHHKQPGTRYSFWDACFVDVEEMRRECQDTYAILCYVLHSVGEVEKAQKCIQDYNSNRSPASQFQSPIHAHRQLPGLRAIPIWWDTHSHDTTTSAPFLVLSRIHSHFHRIQREVQSVVVDNFTGWSPKLDLRLATSPTWNPHDSWDSIVLNSYGEWREGCQLLPLTCKTLQKEEASFRRLLVAGSEGSRYLQLVGEERLAEGHAEVPTLGIKVYKVSPQAGIKPHTGSAGRLVHSLVLIAPESPEATLTVAGETRSWREGHFISFDDGFYHSVDNPHPTSPRIVLSIVTLHPDLLPGALHPDMLAGASGAQEEL